MKRNHLLPYVSIIRRTFSQSQKDKYCTIPLVQRLRIVKFIETKSKIVFTRSLGDGKMASYCLMGTEFQLCKMKSVLEMNGGDSCTTM